MCARGRERERYMFTPSKMVVIKTQLTIQHTSSAKDSLLFVASEKNNTNSVFEYKFESVDVDEYESSLCV